MYYFRTNLSILAVCAVVGLGSPAMAQDGTDDLRARQAALYEDLLERPNDLELMFLYAEVSLRLEDLEAGISTLERMLILQPGLPRVQLELGAAYFRLGAYDVAQYYFDGARSYPNVPDDVLAKIAVFEGQIKKRTARSGFVGEASVGLTYATNANLGPNDANVLALGVPATLDSQFVSNDDFGIRAIAAASHFYDLERPNSDFWRTDLALFALRYFEEDSGDVEVVAFTTGPSLSLDSDQFGTKIRPFFSLDHVRSEDEALYSSGSIGAELSETIDSKLSLFGRGEVGYRGYFGDNEGFDGAFGTIEGGAAYAMTPDLQIRGRLRLDHENAEDMFNANTEVGARMSVTYLYDPGLSYAERKWSITTYGQVDFRWFHEEDPSVSSTEKRDDIDLRFGASNVFNLVDGAFGRLDVDYLNRYSDLPNFSLDNFAVTASLGYRF